jgi:hypothetical protein
MTEVGRPESSLSEHALDGIFEQLVPFWKRIDGLQNGCPDENVGSRMADGTISGRIGPKSFQDNLS